MILNFLDRNILAYDEMRHDSTRQPVGSSREIIWWAFGATICALDASRVLFENVSSFGKGITRRDEIIAKRSIVADALFETIIALGWTRSDYWWAGQFHFARIIAQSMCLAVPKFRVIRVETDRTGSTTDRFGIFAQNNEILVNKLRFIPIFYQINMR